MGLSIQIPFNLLLLIVHTDVSKAFSTHLRKQREKAKMSRDELAKRSSVPASTIKKFELTGRISFRQLLLLWQCLDDLTRLYNLTKIDPNAMRMPTTIEEVLNDKF